MAHTKWAWSLFILDAAVGLDQVLTLVQGTSLLLGHPIWMSVLLAVVMTANAVQKVCGLVVGATVVCNYTWV